MTEVFNNVVANLIDTPSLWREEKPTDAGERECLRHNSFGQGRLANRSNPWTVKLMYIPTSHLKLMLDAVPQLLVVPGFLYVVLDVPPA